MNKKSKKHTRQDDGMVYSTNENFDFSPFAALADQPPSNAPKQKERELRVMLDKKARGGKKVTLVTGFTGFPKDIEALGKQLKSQCGVGGSVKDREIIIQGDFKEKIYELLKADGYGVKKVGG